MVPAGRALCGILFLIHVNCVVFSAGMFTADTRTRLLSWISWVRIDSVNP